MQSVYLVNTVTCVAAIAALLPVATADLLACCNYANSECHGVCSNLFSEVSDLRGLSSAQFQDLTLACSSSNHQLWACVNQTTASPATITELTPTEVTQVTAPANAYCCDRAQGECRDTCKRELGHHDQAVAIQRVIGVCGPPPTGPMWECFLAPTTDPPELEPVNVDWARIQCCNHASASMCRDSCIKLYSGIISSFSWQTLQLDCIHRPSEAALTTCLNDVSIPCKLSCSGLHFCSNFNNRPTMSYRQCTKSADHMARNEYYTWVNYRRINHPLATVHLTDIETCHPELWKALACSVHIQPCNPSAQICREDCIRLLGDCNNSTFSATAICDIITPASSNENCLSLSEYTKPSQYSEYEVSLVTNPCDPNPCKHGFFCSINHLCRHGDLACSHYICRPGCSVGDGDSLVFPGGSRIRVPVGMLSGADQECFGFFNCTIPSDDSGEVQEVSGSSLPPPSFHCENHTHCHIGGRVYPHLSPFQPDECNFCTCFYGRMKCTNLSCPTPENNSTYINCSCDRVYQPVCTVDGSTLPNKCITNCLGYEEADYRLGDCNAFDPCSEHTCDEESRCMPNRRVCLQGNPQDCTQYICEPLLQTCSCLHNPVCDASNTQHSTLCNFLRTQEDFGYHGYCREDCSRIRARPVCGVNGETFKTFCHAESVHVAVDYLGQCKAVPGSGPDGTCAGVVCPPLSHSSCVGVTPWNACCPKCGGHISILMDEKTLNVNGNALGQGVLSSIDIIGRLRHYITSLQCDLYGVVVADGSLSVLVLPVVNASAPIVIEACNQEAKKLATLINNRTPMLASDPLLSHLIAARVDTSQVRIHPSDSNIIGVVSPNSAHQARHVFSFFSVSAIIALFVNSDF